MLKISFSKKAEEDLIDIWSYIAEDNPAAATRVLQSLNQRCELLADNPKLGPARPDIAADLRYFVAGSYLLLYREIQTGIEIVRVLHGARNLEFLFNTKE